MNANSFPFFRDENEGKCTCINQPKFTVSDSQKNRRSRIVQSRDRLSRPWILHIVIYLAIFQIRCNLRELHMETSQANDLCTLTSTGPHGGTGATTGKLQQGGGTRSAGWAGHRRIQRAPAHLQNQAVMWDEYRITVQATEATVSIKMLPLVLGNMELTFGKNVDRAQHINCTQCDLQVRISHHLIRFIYGLISHIHCTGRWYETEVRNNATCLLSQS